MPVDEQLVARAAEEKDRMTGENLAVRVFASAATVSRSTCAMADSSARKASGFPGPI